ncbi:MAG: 50S ribosomal protein L24 [Candidatus Schekmanbacteria bacterium]|nr:50S ribosomal protein L24 [Candidatus Schekmanbacteria bacterium]
MYIKKGDLVKVIAGKELGKQGKVLKTLPKKDRVIIEKINIIKRHTRPTQKNQQGGIIEKEGSIHYSNALLVCSKCNNGVRTGVKILEDGSKVRVCKACGEQI